MDEDPYSSASSHWRCVAGLGNPGSRYRSTPHNVGFLVLDELERRHGIQIGKAEGSAMVGTGRIANASVVLLKPQTFMNLSGSAVGPVLNYRNLTARELIVVHDELDLPWTALRIRKNGSAAGHNGVRSIIAALKTEIFTRVRVGIHPNHAIDAANYVLAPWERELKNDVEEVVSYTADAVESIVAEGVDMAMAKFNRRARGLQEEEE